VLLCRAGDRDVVVEGHTRLRQAIRDGEAHVDAVVLPGNASVESIVLHCLLSHPARELSSVEKIVALYKTAHVLEHGMGPVPMSPRSAVTIRDDMASVYKSVFKTTNSGESLERLLCVLEFDDEELALLNVLNPPLGLLRALVELDRSERRLYLLLHARAHFTTSQSRKLKQMLLAARGAVLDPGFQDTMVASAASGATGDALLRNIRLETHPLLSARVGTMNDHLRSLKLPPAIALKAPENLEGSNFSCYFRFSSAEELTAHLARLEGAVKDGRIEELIRHLNDV
jgi:hypothetical protein